MGNYYFVATTPNGRFLGAKTLEEISADVQSGQISDNYVVTETNGASYSEMVKNGGARWMTISQFLSSTKNPPSAHLSTQALIARPKEHIDRRSGWTIFLRLLAGISLLVSLLGGITSSGGIIVFAVGLVGAIQSLFFAFLVDVFTDIRWFLKKIADEKSSDD
jgi:hypothetical protein